MQEKLHHIESCFTAINGYPKWLLKQTLNSFKTSNKSYNNKINNKNTNDTCINKLSNSLKPVYSGHAILRTFGNSGHFLRYRPNHGQNLIEKPLYSGEFYSGHLS